MAGLSAIEWTEVTWNPTTGCDRVSPGCDNCYALTMARRLKAMGQPDYQRDGDPRTSGPGFGLTTHSHRLDAPLQERKPRRIFVNSMSDLFHKDVPDEFIVEVFAVMAVAERHTFQVLTKRHARMRAVLSSPGFREQVARAAGRLMEDGDTWCDYVMLGANWPLRHVWLGVSVEDQMWADNRIPALLKTPAAVRWVSAEPLLGPLDLLDPYLIPSMDCPCERGEPYCDPTLDWVVLGGESGPGARPMQLQWALDVQRHCQEASTPYFFKQTGTVLARELGLKGKGDDPEQWPEPWPQQYPG